MRQHNVWCLCAWRYVWKGMLEQIHTLALGPNYVIDSNIPQCFNTDILD